MSLAAKNIDWQGKLSGEVGLSEKFTGEVKEQAVYESVLALLASRRSGLAKTKERGEVSGGGKKPYRQKGTGNARHGTSRSPLFAGGGTTFGPKPRDYSFALPKKIKKLALRTVIADKAQNDKIRIVDRFDAEKPSTKVLSSFFNQAGFNKAIFVDLGNDMLSLSVRNLSKASYADARSVNVYDLLKYDYLVITSEAMSVLEGRVEK